VAATSYAGRCHIDLARMDFGVRDQLGNGFDVKRRVRHNDVGLAGDAGHRRDIADEVEGELVIERRIDGGVRTDHQERVAVRWRTHDRLGRDIGTGAGPVLDDEGLAEALR